MFPQRLRELRTEYGLTLSQLGKRLQIDYSTLSKYEAGSRRPRMQTLGTIADFFNVSTDYLLGKTDKHDILYVQSCEALPPEALKELESYIQYLRVKYK